ncbi:MAG TPA: sigma-70 family RNA polymerase sigma factor [Gemmatimonadales bacterium]|nr:sigma-70 family RNA polymerase sigma factor [Gemmatimonadales bacterium]
MTTPTPAEVTGLLLQWSRGDAEALQRLTPLVYDECRRIAERQLHDERPDHTLSPTALVHELYLRLVDQRRTTWKNRAQFFGVAAELMRRILVDYARRRQAQKRGGAGVLVSLDAALDATNGSRSAEVLALNEALGRLGERDPEQQRIVELRFFAGLTVEEIAHVLGRSPRTVKREWRLAKAWLFRELHPQFGNSA